MRLTAIKDRNDNTIALRYNAEGSALANVIDSGGREVRVQSDDEGHIKAFFLSDGQGQWLRLAEYDYDDSGRLVRAADAGGHAHHYAYNDRNQLVLDEDRAGLRFHFRFDPQGRCAESWGDYGDRPDPSLADGLPRFLHDGTTRCKGIHHCLFEWGDDGLCVVTDSTQSSSFFGNEFGLIDKMVEGGAVTTATYRPNARVRIEYDAQGNVTTVKEATGGIWRNRYDLKGRRTHTVDPLGQVTECTFTERGDLVSLRDALGNVTRFAYDGEFHLKSVVSAEGRVTELVWGGYHKLVQRKAPNGDVFRLGYNTEGELTKIWNEQGELHELFYGPSGTLREEKTFDGRTLSYKRDAMGRTVAIRNGARERRPTSTTTCSVAWSRSHCLMVSPSRTNTTNGDSRPSELKG